MRMASPQTATAMPNALDRAVRRARTNTRTPNTKPSATRRRASTPTSVGHIAPRLSDTTGLREAALDGRDPLGALDVEQAHAIETAAAQVMALAHRIARERDVRRRQRTVARGTRRPIDA